MNFFTKTFANLKSSVVRVIVEKELNTLEDKITRSEPFINLVGNTILNIYKFAFEEFNGKIVEVVADTKQPITNLVVENYETLYKILNLVKSLDTERNRKLVGEIAMIAINHAKTWNNEVQEHFEDTMEQSVINASKEFDKIWDMNGYNK